MLPLSAGEESSENGSLNELPRCPGTIVVPFGESLSYLCVPFRGLAPVAASFNHRAVLDPLPCGASLARAVWFLAVLCAAVEYEGGFVAHTVYTLLEYLLAWWSGWHAAVALCVVVVRRLFTLR